MRVFVLEPALPVHAPSSAEIAQLIRAKGPISSFQGTIAGNCQLDQRQDRRQTRPPAAGGPRGTDLFASFFSVPSLGRTVQCRHPTLRQSATVNQDPIDGLAVNLQFSEQL